jgi:ATP-binding cassette subfamily F protein uup
LTGKQKPDSGEILPGLTTKFGYFTQEAIHLNYANRVIEEVKTIAEFITLSDGTQVSASKFLDNFLFPPEKQYTFIEKLSGGEMKRLQLLKLLITNPNFLVLDEPTNDFDIDTLNVLEDFLVNFTGCLLLVSHDRYFMDHLVDQLFVFEGDGSLRIFNGNYSDYRNWMEEEEQLKSFESTTPIKSHPQTKTAEPQRKLTYKEKQEFEQLQKEISVLERERDSLTEKMNSGSEDHLELQEWSQQVQKVGEQIEAKTLRWLELSELAE